MGTLIFDIETVGDTWESFDGVTQSSLMRWINKTARTKDEHKVLTQDLKDGLGFSPLTGKIVAIGLYDVERRQGAVYYTGNGSETDCVSSEYILKQRSEKEMLEDFWEGARSYDTFVTFNGRSFDVPFLMHRSAIQGVTSTVNLMEGRYPYQQKTVRHVDLQDAMTFYGAMQRKGNLHLFCRAYGIESPKQEGISGDDVTQLFARGKFQEIALYNIRDVVATAQLYKKWQQYFSVN